MQIGDTQVVTPYDDAYPFDVDWRHVLAVAWSDNPSWVPSEPGIANDKWVQGCRDYLSLLKTGEHAVAGKRWKPYRRAMIWNGDQNPNEPKFRIEPLLLTGSTFEIIAEDMGSGCVTSNEVETYSRLFLDVREKDGMLSRSCYLRSKSALPNQGTINAGTSNDIVWRAAAMSYGYRGLMFMWNWPPNEKAQIDESFLYDEILRAIQARQMDQILRNEMGNFDMNALVGHYIDYKRLQYDTGEKEDADSELVKMTMGVLEAVQPNLLSAAKTVDEKSDETQAIQAKFMADSNIGRQSVEDKGELQGNKSIDEMIEKHVSS